MRAAIELAIDLSVKKQRQETTRQLEKDAKTGKRNES
jgi:hypothetical protein